MLTTASTPCIDPSAYATRTRLDRVPGGGGFPTPTGSATSTKREQRVLRPSPSPRPILDMYREFEIRAGDATPSSRRARSLPGKLLSTSSAGKSVKLPIASEIHAKSDAA